jgi:hypothetical protein
MSRGHIRRLEKLEEKYKRDHPVRIQLYWIETEKLPDGQVVRKYVKAY